MSLQIWSRLHDAQTGRSDLPGRIHYSTLFPHECSGIPNVIDSKKLPSTKRSNQAAKKGHSWVQLEKQSLPIPLDSIYLRLPFWKSAAIRSRFFVSGGFRFWLWVSVFSFLVQVGNGLILVNQSISGKRSPVYRGVKFRELARKWRDKQHIEINDRLLFWIQKHEWRREPRFAFRCRDVAREPAIRPVQRSTGPQTGPQKCDLRFHPYFHRVTETPSGCI